MRNITKQAGPILLLLSGIGCFTFFLLKYPYHLFHKEQVLLFTYSAETLSDYLHKPAVLSCLAGDFLTQFFLYPGAGPILVASLVMILGLLSYATISKWINRWISIGLVGLLIGWEILRWSGLAYPAASTLSLIGGFGLFLLFNKLKPAWIRTSIGLLAIPLTYWLFGYGTFIFFICAIVSAFTNRKEWISVLVMCIMIAFFPAWMSRFYLQTYSQAYQYPSTGWWDMPNYLHERLIRIDIESHKENWNEVIRLSYPPTDVSAGSYYYNLAHAMQNQLPDKLMNYYQPGLEGLFIPVSSSSSYLSTLFASEVWFQLGDMTMAEHATLLSMIFSPQHKGARMIQRLAEINLINGDEAAAMKYLRLLSHTFAYQEWAAERMPGYETPQVKQWLDNKRTWIAQSDTLRTSTVDIVTSLRLLLKSNPENQVARDYLLCFHLLQKDIDSFIQDYVAEPGVAPKRLYAEALLIDLVRRKAGGEEIQRTIVSPAIMQDFKEYTRIHQQCKGDPSPLVSRFGKSYWFYFHFAQSQS